MGRSGGAAAKSWDKEAAGQKISGRRNNLDFTSSIDIASSPSLPLLITIGSGFKFHDYYERRDEIWRERHAITATENEQPNVENRNTTTSLILALENNPTIR